MTSPFINHAQMITRSELRKIARERFRDAEVLYEGTRYDGSIYLCGYAVELTIKARICTTLRWAGFPSTSREFENFKSFKIHDLDVLLSLTGREMKIHTTHLGDWSVVNKWDPESRYKPPLASELDARSMIESTRRLMRVL